MEGDSFLDEVLQQAAGRRQEVSGGPGPLVGDRQGGVTPLRTELIVLTGEVDDTCLASARDPAVATSRVR